MRQEKDTAAAQAKIKKALEDLASKLSKDEKKQLMEGLSQVEGQLSSMLNPWFRYFLEYDPRPALRKVTCPVLALGGDKDLQVDAQVNLPIIAATLKEGGNKDVITKEFPGLNHLFQTCKSGSVSEYGQIEETIAPVVLQTIADWIQQRTSEAAKAQHEFRAR